MGLDQAIRKLTPEVAAKIITRQEDGWEDLSLDEREAKELTGEEYNTIEELWTGRKENHIHRAIEEITGLEIGNCDYIFLTKEQVQKLVDRLESVRNDHSLASVLLPTQDGFFFGSTGYHERYFTDIENELLDFKLILQDWEEGGHYAYWAWW